MPRIFSKVVFSTVLPCLLLIGCNTDKKTSDSKASTDQKPPEIAVPKFDRDSAFTYVAQQVAFGPRVPNTAAHEACKNWLVSKLKSYGVEVIEQNFKARAYTGTMLDGTNIIAQYKPENPRRIVLASHWDSRHITDSPLTKGKKDQPVMGADDGASGVGILLEIARTLQANPVDFGVDLVFFDSEDHGDGGPNAAPDTWCLGSQYWARNSTYKNGIKPEYGILLDMVGASAPRFGHEEYSEYYAKDVVDKVWDLAFSMGYSNIFVDSQVGGITDDHVYVNQLARIPMVDIINRPEETQTGFVAHWHTPEDTLDKIDRITLKSVGQLLLAVIYREYAGTL
jgi:Zn-dependent M28 family amino/carboxypeptidase